MSVASSSPGRSPRTVLQGLRQLATPLPGGEFRVVPDAYVVCEDGRVTEVGSGAAPPGGLLVDTGGLVALPGFVDSHTHAIFGKSRADEFERRVRGETYEDIAASGGGILASVADLRRKSEDELVETAIPRLMAMLAGGTTTAEIKSGYGLSTSDELKTLRAIRRLRELVPLELVPTFLGAHAIPGEFRSDRAGYIGLLTREMLPAVAAESLARFCDVFCDRGAFTLDETETVLEAARSLGFGLKVHADELESLGATELAVRLGAVSADHLLRVRESGIRALAGGRTVATLLPSTALFLGLPYGPARRLLDAGVRVALATDFNPGSSPCVSMATIWTLACCGMRMSVVEALGALTLGGARALAMEAEVGCLTTGYRADIGLFDVADYREIPYFFGANRCMHVLRGGRVVWSRPEASSGACPQPRTLEWREPASGAPSDSA